MHPWTVALLLILLPGEPPQEAVRYPFALQDVAVLLEILDPREAGYFFVNSEDCATNLETIRRRLAELSDAPPDADQHRFPERAYGAELLAFNRAYRQQLDMRQPGEPARWAELNAAIVEADTLYRVWDTARDARCEYYYVTVRRAALKRLRELLGEEAYYAGRLPPHVPVWRFAEVGPVLTPDLVTSPTYRRR